MPECSVPFLFVLSISAVGSSLSLAFRGAPLSFLEFRLYVSPRQYGLTLSRHVFQIRLESVVELLRETFMLAIATV